MQNVVMNLSKHSWIFIYVSRHGVVHNHNSTLVFLTYTIENPLYRTLVIRIVNFPDRLGPSGKFVENSTKPHFFEFNGYLIKYSSVLWFL